MTNETPQHPHPETPPDITYDEVMRPSAETGQLLTSFVRHEREAFQAERSPVTATDEEGVAHLDHVMLLAQGLMKYRDMISQPEYAEQSTIRWAKRGNERLGVSLLGITDDEVRANFWGVKWTARRQGIALNLLKNDIAYLRSHPEIKKEFLVDAWEGSKALFEHPDIQALGVKTEILEERLGNYRLKVTLTDHH